MDELAAREAESDRLEGEMAEVCGVLNAATGRLVGLIVELEASQCWQVSGIHSIEQWVSWKCGLSPRRARGLVAMARRMGELPVTGAALVAGELSEDQVAVICAKAPACTDEEVSELARNATVSQLRRVLGRYSFDPPAEAAEDEPPGEPDPGPPTEEPRRVSFGHGDNGAWRLSALLPPDEGALVERAMAEAREELFRSGVHGASADDVSWADALVAMAERSLAAGAVARPHRDRHLVLLHLRAGAGGHLHLGPGLSEGLRQYLSCDARVRAVVEADGKAVSVGRSFRVVPERTRIAVEDRDGGCRVPGCDRHRWLHVHHVRHWTDGGATDTPNLLALCQFHHRLHHRGGLGIAGDADQPDGVVFTDERGRPLQPCGRPTPPGDRPPPAGHWVPPPGEPIDPWAIYFNEPAGAHASAQRTGARAT